MTKTTKTTKTKTEIEALTPEYLTARVDAAAARKALGAAKGRAAWLPRLNADHAAEVKGHAQSGYPLVTQGQVLRRGTGGGVNVIYRRCNCDGFIVECDHDPRESPVTEAEIAEAREAVTEAEAALVAADNAVTETPPTLHVFANARAVGAGYVWWPSERYVDPRRRHYRGQPLTEAEVEGLGYHGLARAIAAGSILEVPA